MSLSWTTPLWPWSKSLLTQSLNFHPCLNEEDPPLTTSDPDISSNYKFYFTIPQTKLKRSLQITLRLNPRWRTLSVQSTTLPPIQTTFQTSDMMSCLTGNSSFKTNITSPKIIYSSTSLKLLSPSKPTLRTEKTTWSIPYVPDSTELRPAAEWSPTHLDYVDTTSSTSPILFLWPCHLHALSGPLHYAWLTIAP